MRSFDSHCLITLLSMSSYLCVHQQMLSHSLMMRLYQGRLKNSFFQTYMYAVFKVQSWLTFHQSFKKKISFLLKSLVKPALSHQVSLFFSWSGGHLLSHIVSNAVPSAAQVLTVVFGMGTGVSPERIATGRICILFLDNSTVKHIQLLHRLTKLVLRTH